VAAPLRVPAVMPSIGGNAPMSVTENGHRGSWGLCSQHGITEAIGPNRAHVVTNSHRQEVQVRSPSALANQISRLTNLVQDRTIEYDADNWPTVLPPTLTPSPTSMARTAGPKGL
jgi:hypothetical protein